MMTYKDAIEYLYSLSLFGAKLGLENTFRLAELAGNPQQNLRFVHVAGTNGKGSTCAMLESIYRTAGFRTGLFTSPHLVSFCERIQVNREVIPQEAVVRLVAEIRELITHLPQTFHPTFFEVITVMALKYFAEQNCDVVIWETGLGGRLDATNIVSPLASVITNIAHDHMQWLGDTLEKIAFEKAGIIKPGVPAIIGPMPSEALTVMRQTAAERHSPCSFVTEEEVRELKGIKLGLLGEHQRTNAAVACRTSEVLQAMLPVPQSAIRIGLETVRWAGRLQEITTANGRRVLLDGAHNVAGANALRTAIEEFFPLPFPALIIGMLGDKDCEAICQSLAPLASAIYLCPVQSERTAQPETLARYCAAANPKAEIHCCNSLREALDITHEFSLLTGSLYFIGQALELLAGGPVHSEARLNEWFLPART